MADVFNEQIVKRLKTPADSLKQAGLVTAVVVLGIITLASPLQQVVFIVLGLGGFGAYFLSGFLNVEYEYVITNGELDIDIIYNKARRKRLFSAQVRNIEIFAHVENMNFAGNFSGAQDVRNYGSGGKNQANTYAFLINVKNRQTKVIMEPNEKMLKAIGSGMARSKFHA